MVRFIMYGFGATFAGLYFGLRDLLPMLAAQRSGVITRRGYAQIKVTRQDDPERFKRLIANRIKGTLFGFSLSATGLIAFLVGVYFTFYR